MELFSLTSYVGLLLICRHVIDVSMFTVAPLTLLTSCIYSTIFYVDSLVFSTYTVMLFTDKDGFPFIYIALLHRIGPPV